MQKSVIGDRIRIAADKIGGGSELSRQTGINRGTVQRYITGENEVKAGVLEKIANVTGVSLEWLVTGQEPNFSDKLCERVRQAINNNGGIEAFSIASGLDQDRLEYAIEGMRALTATQLAQVAKTANVSFEWLITGQESTTYSEEDLSSVVPVPLLDIEASAGNGSVIYDEFQKSELFLSKGMLDRQYKVSPSDVYVMYANGESMEPTLKSGEMLACSKSPQHIKPADGVYIIRMDGDLFVKRIQKLPGNVLKVTSDNPAYHPFNVDLKDVESGTIDFQILGKVLFVHTQRSL